MISSCGQPTKAIFSPVAEIATVRLVFVVAAGQVVLYQTRPVLHRGAISVPYETSVPKGLRKDQATLAIH